MRNKTQLALFLNALLVRPLSTNEIMREVGTTRPPNLATEARKRYQLDLPCKIVSYIDNNGLKGTYGVYYFTLEDMEKVQKALGGDGE